jgi:iron complex outermembrane receptor protein
LLEQTASARPESSEIVVTAQKRLEREQDVPIAMSAIPAAEIDRRNMTDLAGLAGLVPSLSIAGYTGGNASNMISIRGVAGQVLPIGAGQPVALYLDGVYLSRPDAAFFGLDDVERIEVLRGPQGTLYGRNATAGAINIITRAPGDELHIGGEASVGNRGSLAARGSVRTPLGHGFSAGLSASHLRHDGFIRNTVTGHRLNDRKGTTVRAQLRYRTPGDGFEATLSADYTHDVASPIFKNGYSAGVSVGIGDPNSFESDVASERVTRRTNKNRGVAFTLTYRPVPELDLVSVTSWRDFSSKNLYDADASAAPAFLTGATNGSETISQELRGVFVGHKVRATLGATLYVERSRYGLSTVAPGVTPPFNYLVATSDLTALAIFSQVEIDLLPRLTLVGGLRYDRERRDFAVDYRSAAVPGPRFTGDVGDNVVIPSLHLSHRVGRDALFYAKASRGYLAPGFNFAPGATASRANTFLAEKLWAYEVGAKVSPAPGLHVEAAAFHYDYSNIQIRSTVGLGLTNIENAASASIDGVEGSIRVDLPGGFSVGARGTYLDARYDQFCQPISAGDPQGANISCRPGFADRSGNRLNLAPKWSGGLDVGYLGSLSQTLKLKGNATYDFSTSIFYTGAANETELSSGSWGVLGARISLEIEDGPEVFIFGRNLADKRFLSFSARVGPQSIFNVVSDPRTIGVGIGYRF